MKDQTITGTMPDSPLSITGRDDRPAITGAVGLSGLTADARRWLAEHGISEEAFQAAVEDRRMEKRRRKMEANLEEWGRILREHAAYEKRQRERERTDR